MHKAVQEHRQYTRPELIRVGSLESLTEGHKTGGKTDAFFPAGTPKGDVTFS